MKIKKAEYMTTAVYASQFPESNLPEVVFSGRSNVGKSSLINMLVGRKKLAYFSQKPGKTQTLNFYNINDTLVLVDIPGYGYAKVSKKQKAAFVQMIECYFTTREQCCVVCLLLDIRHDPTNDDISMFEFLNYHDIPLLILCTKADKLSRNKQLSAIRNIKKTLGIIDNDRIPFVLTSASSGQGKDEAWQAIQQAINENEQ